MNSITSEKEAQNATLQASLEAATAERDNLKTRISELEANLSSLSSQSEKLSSEEKSRAVLLAAELEELKVELDAAYDSNDALTEEKHSAEKSLGDALIKLTARNAEITSLKTARAELGSYSTLALVIRH